ncbi:Abi family protein [Granulicatella elegans]|uniref:Abi family protein n=1 Tax=Granulicatella elegans TaxID=137732 RepID=UPI001D157180|nr:Abi family protein [Granulicatella elegans]UEA30646.1 Abi family protein [Granulicatella elegans]
MIERYPNKYDYLKTESYNSESTLEIHRTLSSISQIIMKMKNSKNDNSIKHHINQYKTVPLWVIINELDLGTVKYMYIHSDAKVRNDVAKRLYEYMYNNTKDSTYTKLDANTVDIVLHCINDLRNCCAHNHK